MEKWVFLICLIYILKALMSHVILIIGLMDL